MSVPPVGHPDVTRARAPVAVRPAATGLAGAAVLALPGVAALVTGGPVLAWPWPAAARPATGPVPVLPVGPAHVWPRVHHLPGGWAPGLAWCLLVAVLLHALPGGRAALPPR